MKNSQPVTLGFIGCGVVGGGALQLLKDHQSTIEERVGAPVRVKWVCRRTRKKGAPLPGAQHTTRWQDVVNDPDVDCVVELMGGLDPARKVVMTALKNGKHVVTANKAILSRYWNDIFQTAHDHRVLVYFEAAVGGGVPVVQALNEGMAANEISKIVGILNGTTNFILTRMQESGLDFATALKEAQQAGFAEADPTFDIEGVDAAQKVSILASLAARRWISPSHVHTEGISQLDPLDIRLIQQRCHGAIKLLGIAEKTSKGWVCRVHPAIVSQAHPFANVRHEYNAVALVGHAVGDVMLYGKGAGRFPTASAVVSDILFLCRQIANGTAGRLPYVGRPHASRAPMGTIDDIRCRYYLRVNTKDQPGVLANITGVLSRHHVSIAAVYQDTVDEQAVKTVPVVLLTHISREADVQAAVKKIDRLPAIKAKTVLLRME